MQLAHALPPVVTQDIPAAGALTKRGEAVLRFIGLKVYDIRLWTNAKPPHDSDLFALELVYDLGLKGAEIAKRSVEEMRKQGVSDEAKLAKWLTAMNSVFPDIKKNDTLVGVSVPGKGARFYSKDKFIAEIADPEFAAAFFDIWLSPKTSEPRLRARLLNEAK
ncbi:MAG: hypothetical protein HC782_03965 [Gammaproteobacteria bacterium]|nr:hypothetical protein [Gammaproteobacteria bacterium]